MEAELLPGRGTGGAKSGPSSRGRGAIAYDGVEWRRDSAALASETNMATAFNWYPSDRRTSLPRTPAMPALRALLTQGGDMRIGLDGATGRNAYGCGGIPDPDLAAFGSSTASTISVGGYRAAGALRDRVVDGGPVRIEQEAARIRQALLDLNRVPRDAGVEAVLAASGTDAHLIFATLQLNRPGKPWLIVMPDPCETGSGVPDAIAGRHFNSGTALGAAARKGSAISNAEPGRTLHYALRNRDGSTRTTDSIDEEVGAAIRAGLADGNRILLVAVDGSKTGLVAPSPMRSTDWKARFGDSIEVLVDACQFRLSTVRLNHYLAGDCAVAVTGSKFMGGPIYSGALLLPAGAAARTREAAFPAGLSAYSARCDWPSHWAAAGRLEATANLGLLLRWEAALAELGRFRAIADERAAEIALRFRDLLIPALEATDMLDPLPPACCDEADAAITAPLDRVPTIFSFRLKRRGGAAGCRSAEEARHIYRTMPVLDCLPWIGPRTEIGQPVSVGEAGALRLSLSAPLLAGADEDGGAALGRLIGQVVDRIDRTARAID